MNVLFHTATAVGLFTVVNNSSAHSVVKISIVLFGGIIMHGILDYTPHCYPLSAKTDIFISASVIAVLHFAINSEARILLYASILGATFPDLVDLGPSMVNEHLGMNIPITDTIFPWHWQKYSGSIYNENCGVSHIHHSVVILCVFTTVMRYGLPINWGK